MPHNSSKYDFITRDISWPRNFSSWRYQLATKIMRFDSIRLYVGGYGTVFKQINLQLEHLKINIRQVMAEILPNTWQKVHMKFI